MQIGPVPLVVFPQMAAFALVAFAFMAITRFLAALMTPFNDDAEILSKQNLAVALRFSGLMAGMVLGMSGALSGDSAGFLTDLTEFSIDGFVVAATLFASMGLLHVVTLRKISINSSLKNGNIAVGWVELGSYVATGLSLFGCFSGDGGNLLEAVAFAALGQVALVLTFWIYEAITPHNLIAEVKKGNVAVGLSIASRLTAIGIILMASLQGDVTDWGSALAGFGVYYLFGMALLVAVDFLADLVFLPKTKIKDIMAQGNIAAVAKLSGVRIAAALVVAAAM
jgi:uncharacterized membrane protein YjfL (UPF0719 family)